MRIYVSQLRIIIFSILFLVVIFCLIYRIYRKRQEEHNESSSNKANKKASTKTNASSEQVNIENGMDSDEIAAEQVKFRGGSMSSVVNRHERVPSKPVIISITTPKGTHYVADAFGEYDGEQDEKDELPLPGIDEQTEENYQQNTQNTQNNEQNVENNGNNESIEKHNDTHHDVQDKQEE